LFIFTNNGSLTNPVIFKEIVLSGLTAAQFIESIKIYIFASKYFLSGINPSQGSSAKLNITAKPYLFKTLHNLPIVTKSSPPVKTLPAV